MPQYSKTSIGYKKTGQKMRDLELFVGGKLDFPSTLVKAEERRNLIKAEMRMSQHSTSRFTCRDKAKSLDTARSPKDSKMGEYLLSFHTRSGPNPSTQLTRLAREQRRLELNLHQSRQTFLRTCQSLNREPVILIERLPAQSVKTKALILAQGGVTPKMIPIPRYMQPSNTTCRTPSTLTTIDAFVAEMKKKRNVWENGANSRERMKFKSTLRPCAKLTDHELGQLRMGHVLHKPTIENLTKFRGELERNRLDTEGPIAHSNSGVESSIFITQLSQREIDVPNSGTNKLANRNATLS